MNLVQENILMHYGVKRRSGRYPWGSDDNHYQHGGDFLSRVEELQRLGISMKLSSSVTNDLTAKVYDSPPR